VYDVINPAKFLGYMSYAAHTAKLLITKKETELARAAPVAKDVKVWGPTPAFYALLRGQTRERLLVQAARGVDVQSYMRAWLALLKIPGAVRVTVDVDPVSFF